MPLPSFLKASLAHPIAFHRSLAELTGSVAAGLLLSQAIYWAERAKGPDGWFYKTQGDWYEETGLTRTEQANARVRLRNFAFWQEQKRGMPATLYYRVDFQMLAAALKDKAGEVSLDQVLHAWAVALKHLSQTGYMRARKARAVGEFVDYAEVLRLHGMTCGVCGQPIVCPPGPKPDCLAFDYIVALAQGGSHIDKNLHPVHVECIAPKSLGLAPSQLSYPKLTSRLAVSQPVLLR